MPYLLKECAPTYLFFNPPLPNNSKEKSHGIRDWHCQTQLCGFLKYQHLTLPLNISPQFSTSLLSFSARHLDLQEKTHQPVRLTERTKHCPSNLLSTELHILDSSTDLLLQRTPHISCSLSNCFSPLHSPEWDGLVAYAYGLRVE